MAEINARTLMFNLGPEDAIDLTTSAKIARYTERKQLAYKLTDEGVLLLDGRGKKIHLKNGVVTLRNALGLHVLPEGIMTNVMREDVSLQGQRCCAIDSIGDNIVLTTDPNLTKQTNMLHVRKMALVDPQLLKSLHEHTTPQPPVDKILRDLDAEMTSILKSDADVSEKVPLYNQLLLRYNEMTKMHAAIPTPVVVMKSNTVDNEPVAVVKSNTVDNEPAAEVTAGQSTELVNIVATLPKTLQEKGRQLLGRLSKVEWKHAILSAGTNSPNKRDPPTYPWSSSATLPGENTCRNPHLQNEFASQNLIFPQAGNRCDRSNRCVVMIRRRCLIFVAVTIIIIFAAVVFLLARAPMEHWCPGGVVVVWGDRNYTDNTTIRNVSEVTVALPLYKE